MERELEVELLRLEDRRFTLTAAGERLMMFSVNPACDLEQGDGQGIGSTAERAKRRCEAEGVGVSVMNPFHGGKLLDENTSPFRTAMTRYQCLQYAVDRPGVLFVAPGVRGLDDLKALPGFAGAAPEGKDYTPQSARRKGIADYFGI